MIRLPQPRLTYLGRKRNTAGQSIGNLQRRIRRIRSCRDGEGEGGIVISRLISMSLRDNWAGVAAASPRLEIAPSGLNLDLLCRRLLRAELSAVVLRKEPIATEQFR